MVESAIQQRPIRVAVIGSGPAGFYAADHLLKQTEFDCEIDMFDKLPTPHGLVRLGVAPDHQKIKSVARVYDKIASNPRFRFFGYVEFGKHIDIRDLERHYHITIFATGAQTDRKLNIPGENFKGSHTATEFVAWYNGHPDYADIEFDLSQENVAIVGVGNVAVDVARILCRGEEELKQTDIANYALELLKRSKVRNVYLLGRRGPAQAAFTNPEVRELGKLSDAQAITYAEEIKLDEHSRKEIEENKHNVTRKKLDILKSYSEFQNKGRSRRLHIRFLVSPTEIIGDEDGNVATIRLVKNELHKMKDGSIKPRPTEEYEEIKVGLVFRSIGYQGVSLPGVPFDVKRGVIHNEKGRIVDPDSGNAVPGLYATGWIKRGSTGVIGTNKQDSRETVDYIILDVKKGLTLNPVQAERRRVEELISERQPDYLTYEDWLRLDEMEKERGKEQGRPRIKYTRIDEMLEALRNEKMDVDGIAANNIK